MATVRNVKPNLGERRQVLVVEDDLNAVHSIATLIKMMGHECQFAINGLAALHIARQSRPDIISLDIGLPDFKGYDIAKQLKWEPGLESTRIIALTALPDADRERAIEAGCQEFCPSFTLLHVWRLERTSRPEGRPADALLVTIVVLLVRLLSTQHRSGDHGSSSSGPTGRPPT